MNKILDDKAKFSFAVAISILSIFAFFLLIKNDLGAFFRMDRVLEETNDSLKILASAADYEKYIDQFDSRFAGSSDSSWPREVLTELAGNRNVKLGSVKPLDGYSISGYKVIRITAEGTASYPDMLLLIADIEGNSRYIYVERLNLRSGIESTNFFTPFTGRQLMPQETMPEQPETRNTKFTLTIASLAREI